MKLQDQLASKDLVVFLGTGGVGKTTIAAAAALKASETRKTLVLTIDPARRLADSMGVKLGTEPTRVTENLDACMLDTKAALDKLIERYAPTPERVKKIFESKFYQQLSDAFAGSEEFVSMGTLYDLYHDGDYELIVVDTPPASTRSISSKSTPNSFASSRAGSSSTCSSPPRRCAWAEGTSPTNSRSGRAPSTWRRSRSS